jgi:peptidoglycan/LPS O-acetylase OafA/YrhL
MIKFPNLKRKTTSNNFIKQIDGLRFLAISTVILFHLNTAVSKEVLGDLNQSFNSMGGTTNTFSLAWWWVRLDLGVKVFFCISGFILALPFLKHHLGFSKKQISIKDYFYRRLLRLEPPFIISLGIFTLIHIVILDMEVSDGFTHLGAGLVYMHVLIFGQPNPINPVTWSLETEAQFYFLVPILFILIFIFKRNTVAFILLILLLLLSAIFKHEYTNTPHVGSSVFSYFINFGVGIFFAWMYLAKQDWIQRKSVGYDILGVVSLIGLFYFYKPQHLFENIVFFNLSIFFLFIATFKSYALNWFFSRKFIYTIGGMCYSIYLLHYAFFHLSVKITKLLWVQDWSYSMNLVIQILLNVPMVLLLSAVFFVLFERPFMDRTWWDRFIQKFKN